ARRGPRGPRTPTAAGVRRRPTSEGRIRRCRIRSRTPRCRRRCSTDLSRRPCRGSAPTARRSRPPPAAAWACSRRCRPTRAPTSGELYESPRRLLRELAAGHPEVGPALERFYRERLLATLLTTATLFKSLPEDQRADLLARFSPVHAESGQALVREGENAGG